jgi:hypothetical protein
MAAHPWWTTPTIQASLFQEITMNSTQQPITFVPVTSPFRHIFVALHWSFALAPLLTSACLYLLSWRAALLLGHWPQPSLDDPKFIAPNDALMDLLYGAVLPLLLWSMVALITFPLLTFFLRKRYTRLKIVSFVVLFVGAWLFLYLDPGARLAWFGD